MTETTRCLVEGYMTETIRCLGGGLHDRNHKVFGWRVT